MSRDFAIILRDLRVVNPQVYQTWYCKTLHYKKRVCFRESDLTCNSNGGPITTGHRNARVAWRVKLSVLFALTSNLFCSGQNSARASNGGRFPPTIWKEIPWVSYYNKYLTCALLIITCVNPTDQTGRPCTGTEGEIFLLISGHVASSWLWFDWCCIRSSLT